MPQDVSDGIPKWKTLPDGEPETATADAPASDITKQPLSMSQVCILGGSFTDAAVQFGSWDPSRGWLRKDVQPLSPTRAPESKVYFFTETDPTPNHVSLITPEKVNQVSDSVY